MPYLVLARKYRPQRFSDLVGQEFVAQTLRNAIRNKRTSHAYLFSGPRGVGKTSAARILAKAVNCLNRDRMDGEPCNTCEVCADITAGQSLDVIEIDGASNRGIEQIRDLRESVKYAPARCAFKVYIIDEVHMLTKEAFNALLKTLEEPPDHVIFVFATTEPHNVPLTILSRCQRYDFRKIPPDLISRHLRAILDREGVRAEDEALALLGRHSGGCLRDAETALDQLIASGDGTVTAEDARRLLGLVRQESFALLLDAILHDRRAEGLRILKTLDDEGVEPLPFFTGLLNFLRNIMVLQNTPPEEARTILDATERELESCQTFASSTDPSTILSLMDTLSEALKDLRWTTIPLVASEILFLKLTEAAQGLNLRNLQRQIQALKEGPTRTKTGPASPPPQPPTATPPSSPPPPPQNPAPDFRAVAELAKKYAPPPKTTTQAPQPLPPTPPQPPQPPHDHANPPAERIPQNPPSPRAQRLPDIDQLRTDWPEFIRSLDDPNLNFLKKIAPCISLEPPQSPTAHLTLRASSSMLCDMLKAQAEAIGKAFQNRYGVLPLIDFRHQPPPDRNATDQPQPSCPTDTAQPSAYEDLYRQAQTLFGGAFEPPPC